MSPVTRSRADAPSGPHERTIVAVEQTVLAVEPLSAGRARRFVSATLARWGMAPLTDTAVLLTSEVVTNALLHTASQRIALRLARLSDGVRVEVDDESAAPPRERTVTSESTTGRGMTLVDASARAWGTEPTDGGKTVWFEVGTGV